MRWAWLMAPLVALAVGCGGGGGTPTDVGDAGDGEDVGDGGDVGDDGDVGDRGDVGDDGDVGDRGDGDDVTDGDGDDVTDGDGGDGVAGKTAIVVTGGGGEINSANYRLRISVGAPQPMGSASTTGHSITVGPGAAH